MSEKEPAFTLREVFVSEPNGGSVSSVTASARFLGVGTTKGDVLVLDLLGHVISRFQGRHGSRVSGLSFGGGRFEDDALASVGRDDRMLIVTSTIVGEISSVSDIKTRISGSAALNGVAIDPKIDTAPQGKRIAVACSDGKVQIFTTSWFIGSQSTLREGEGEVRSISWSANLLAWSTPTRVRVFDMQKAQGVCMIGIQDNLRQIGAVNPIGAGSLLQAQEEDILVRAKFKSQVTLRMNLPDEFALCVAANNVIKVFSLAKASTGGWKVIPRHATTRETFQLSRNDDDAADIYREVPFLGATLFGEEEIACLHVVDHGQGLELGEIPFDGSDTPRTTPISIQGDLENAGIISVPGSEPMALVFQASRAYVATSRSPVERLEWMMERSTYPEAIDLVGRTPLPVLRHMEDRIYEFSNRYLQLLQSKGDWEQLANVLPTVIQVTTFPPARTSKEGEGTAKGSESRWTEWIRTFQEAGKMSLLVDSIPTKSLQLEKEVYNGVLEDLAQSHPETWKPHIYDSPLATRLVEGQMRRAPRDANLKEALMILYDHSQRHDETLQMLLRDRSPKVFDYVTTHKFYEAIRSKESLERLYEIDSKKTTALLARAPESVLPSRAVVPILEDIGDRERLYNYLHTLFNVNPEGVSPYNKTLLELYCDYGAPGSLMRFLKSSHYSLEHALAVVRSAHTRWRGEKSFAPEIVFVLRRMGDFLSALNILLEESHDVDGAIDFARELGDAELWERLLEKAAHDEEILSKLLDAPNDNVDPLRLVELLTEESRVPNLQRKLYQLVIDAKIERELRETSMSMLADDVRNHMQSLEDLLRKPL